MIYLLLCQLVPRIYNAGRVCRKRLVPRDCIHICLTYSQMSARNYSLVLDKPVSAGLLRHILRLCEYVQTVNYYP